jgi:hypothetical protein
VLGPIQEHVPYRNRGAKTTPFRNIPERAVPSWGSERGIPRPLFYLFTQQKTKVSSLRDMYLKQRKQKEEVFCQNERNPPPSTVRCG